MDRVRRANPAIIDLVDLHSATRSAELSQGGARKPPSPPVNLLGQRIGRYLVRRLLGAGGMGQVYLCRDEVLGRSVALKLVHASRADAVLHEARAIARLNHPHIVQLYESVEHNGRVFLALEYVEGETLGARMGDEPIGRDEALRYARAIAEALVHAHANDVVHCDLKPTNVMIGRDGRLRVVDFGIARTEDGETSGGTPDWMAPEQWEAQKLTDRVDIWALAIVIAQLLTGRHPLGGSAERRKTTERAVVPELATHDLPAGIAELITRSLVFEPASRPSATEWLHALEHAINRPRELAVEDAPYPGLAAFDEQRAGMFFGRDQEVDEFLERLRDSTHLTIAGPSGAGKSSFLYAGVIPRLRAREHWTVIAFRPGADPIGALAHKLIAAGDDYPDPAAFRSHLLANPAFLAARLATLPEAGWILLAVDQLEEAFTHGSSELERGRFLAMLLAAADDPRDPVRIVFTVRDDFVGQIEGLRALFVIHALRDPQLRRTITEPLARQGYGLDDPAIVDDLIREVGGATAGKLPLLQFACRMLWDGRDPVARRIRRATYREIGGLAGALAHHAEAALAELTPAERRIARRLLLRLVAGTTRRSVARAELVRAIGPGTGAVIDRLVRARLLVSRSQEDGDDAIIEIIHESLLQNWAQLARWVDESRDERRLLDELDDAAARWERRGRRVEDTWSASELVAARHRIAQLGVGLPEHLRAFLAAGDDRHRRQRRRRGVAVAAFTALALVVAVWLVRYVAREQLIRSNFGTIDLVLQPYDWIDGAAHPVHAGALPELRWTLHDADPRNRHRESAARSAELITRLGEHRDPHAWTYRLRTPGGMAFLAVDGRGRLGERCAPAMIRLQSLPGYAGNRAPERVVVRVPTCQVTQAGMIEVPAGQFVYGGPGEPASPRFGREIDHTEDEQQIFQGAFAMDRTEVSNAAFEAFAQMAVLTGYPKPIYTSDSVHVNDADPRYPVTEIDVYQAEAYCRYLGKQLPTERQYVKAVRGGLTLGLLDNPSPRRMYPWGAASSADCVNLGGKGDLHAWVAPVESMPCGASPYGILHLVGNVQEWLSADGQMDGSELRVLRGGSVESPRELDHGTVIFRNHREPQRMQYDIGFRCVSQMGAAL